MLSPAKKNDMPTNWSFNWLNLWQNTDFECQNIVKLVYKGKVWGLVRYGLYPYPGSPKFLEIEQIEAHPTSRGEEAERFMELLSDKAINQVIRQSVLGNAARVVLLILVAVVPVGRE